MNYHSRLLEAICDKLDIDYSEMKAEAISDRDKIQQERKERNKKLDAELEQSKQKSDAIRDRMLERIKKFEEDRKPVTAAERPALELAYINAEKASKAAWDAYTEAFKNGANALQLAEIQNKALSLQKETDKIERRLFPLNGAA